MLQSDEDEIVGHVVLELRPSHGNVWVASVGQCPVSSVQCPLSAGSDNNRRLAVL